MQEVVDMMPELMQGETAIDSSRWFAAPRAMVYAAFTDPKQVVRWWGPRGFTATVEEMDLRPGGMWRLVMHGPDGTDYPNEMTILEVAPMEHVRLRLTCGREGAAKVTFLQTLTWAEENGGTRFGIRVEFESREARDRNVREYGSVEGVRELYARLAAHLHHQPVAGGAR